MSSSRAAGSLGLGGRRARPPARRLLRLPVVWGLIGAFAFMFAGCGLGAGATPSAIHLTVTEDFGAKPVGPQGPPKVRGQETVLSLLIRNHKVTTRYGGGFV